ncbi:sugar-binding domain-containing protein [uncultured Chitinophaga sp.]|jgi:Beta-galactosidase/beta-glucuronidase|uniref:sugar-binding domain-containing protein n=1 Tax=uncultured Chitinophaga sp. TaxID=339340 RepID=UPI00263552CE|nr:sugar-binding domain-containing protein [uncultured Chitinophaga sp.]
MKKTLMVIAALSFVLVRTYAQDSGTIWKMRPLHIPSRWAKDVNPANALHEYPRPQMVRPDWINLNGMWEYAIKPISAFKPDKFDGKILVPFPVESALSGVMKPLKPDENLWYKRNIKKPDLAVNERLLLHFGAVDWETTVFINDKEVGKHSGGYQRFYFDITDFLKDGNNELLVKVFDPTDQGPNPHGKQVLNPENIYYTPSSGIWQTVWVEKVPSMYIADLKTTPDIDKGILNVTVYTVGGGPNSQIKVTAKIEGKVISQVTSNPGTVIALPVKNARLWSPDDPFLYDLSIELVEENTTLDKVESYFGMRKISIQKDEKGVDRIFLNNRYTYNLGILDQGFWPDGLYTAPTDEALAFDIKAIKAMGFNTIRKHIKVEPERWYFHADKIGMLVWQDFVNPPHLLPEGATQHFEKEVKETMQQLSSHPSIVTWVLFNERWGAYDQKRLTEWVKVNDPSRLVNGHSGELLYVDEQLRAPADSPWVSSDMTDVHSYPDPMQVPGQPGKARVLGEFGGIGVSVPDHEWNDLQGWGYVQGTPSELAEKYKMMMEQLKKLEVEGLSASIYTQPFDVEGEENGLLTYDREMIKMPVKKLRELNQALVKQTKIFEWPGAIAKDIDINDTDVRYGELIKLYQKEGNDSSFLRRLLLMSFRSKDSANTRRLTDAYLKKVKNIFAKDNLLLLKHITLSTKDAGFRIFSENASRIDQVLGVDAAGIVVRSLIWNEFSPVMLDKEGTANYSNLDASDFERIRKQMVSLYGRDGERVFLVQKAFYYYYRFHQHHTGLEEWCSTKAKIHELYPEETSVYDMNNDAWLLFISTSDPEKLEMALSWSRKVIEKEPTANYYDTYANILYKLGRTREAIRIQEIALTLNPGNGRIDDVKQNLEKMRRGVKTWN